MTETFLGGRITLHHGDSLDVIRTLHADSVDAVVCDPPYGLGTPPDPLEMLRAWLDTGHLDVTGRGFMGREWDAFVPQPALWREVFRVLKPGGHVLAFFGTRTYDIGSLAIRLAGFEIRDQLAWVYGSGFPKSHDVSKAIDKALGLERSKVRYAARPASSGTMAGSSDTRPWIEKSRESGFHEAASDEAAEWSGWGTALKPAWEPIVFGRKPLAGTVAANVLTHGTGAINIDGCRVGDEQVTTFRPVAESNEKVYGKFQGGTSSSHVGRHPANILHDGSDEVVSAFPEAPGQLAAVRPDSGSRNKTAGILGKFSANSDCEPRGDAGTAARFFYSAKADAHDRIGSNHPTVKPVDLMQWLCRLVTPKGGVVLDPFAGSGTTGEAAWREGFRAILVEREAEFCDDIRRRMRLADRPSQRLAVAKSKGKTEAVDALPLFGGLE